MLTFGDFGCVFLELLTSVRSYWLLQQELVVATEGFSRERHKGENPVDVSTK